MISEHFVSLVVILDSIRKKLLARLEVIGHMVSKRKRTRHFRCHAVVV